MSADVILLPLLTMFAMTLGIGLGAWLTHRKHVHRPPIPFTTGDSGDTVDMDEDDAAAPATQYKGL